jgi:hypothetical protein
MTKGRISLEKRKVRKQQRRRFRYDDQTPIVELFSLTVRDSAISWLEKEVLPLLVGNTKIFSAEEIFYFDIKNNNQRHFKKSLAKFLKKIADVKGTKYGEMMIFRYLCDPNHSSLSCQEDSLKTSIYRELMAL